MLDINVKWGLDRKVNEQLVKAHFLGGEIY